MHSSNGNAIPKIFQKSHIRKYKVQNICNSFVKVRCRSLTLKIRVSASDHLFRAFATNGLVASKICIKCFAPLAFGESLGIGVTCDRLWAWGSFLKGMQRWGLRVLFRVYFVSSWIWRINFERSSFWMWSRHWLLSGQAHCRKRVLATCEMKSSQNISEPFGPLCPRQI